MAISGQPRQVTQFRVDRTYWCARRAPVERKASSEGGRPDARVRAHTRARTRARPALDGILPLSN